MKGSNTLVYIRLAAIVIVVLYVAAFVWNNLQESATVWLFPWVKRPTNVVLLIAVTAVVAVLVAWLRRQIFSAMRQLGKRSGEQQPPPVKKD